MMRLFTNVGTQNTDHYGDDFVLNLTEMKAWYKDVKTLDDFGFNSFEEFLSEFNELERETKNKYYCYQHYTNGGKNYVDKIVITIDSDRDIVDYESIPA